MKSIKVNDWREVPENFTGIAEYSNRSKYWYKDGEIHREDGPAVEWFHGYNDWCLEDEMYDQISLKDYIILDYYKGKYGIMWYKLLGKNRIFEYPDIPGLIIK